MGNDPDMHVESALYVGVISIPVGTAMRRATSRPSETARRSNSMRWTCWSHRPRRRADSRSRHVDVGRRAPVSVRRPRRLLEIGRRESYRHVSSRRVVKHAKPSRFEDAIEALR